MYKSRKYYKWKKQRVKINDIQKLIIKTHQKKCVDLF